MAGPVSLALSGPFIARALGVDARGELARCSVPLLLISAAFTVGVPETCVYFMTRRGRSAQSLLVYGLTLLSGVGAVATALLYFFADQLGGSAQAGHLIRLSAFFVIPSLAVYAFRGVAQGANRWGITNLERVIGAVARLALVLGAYMAHRLGLTFALMATVAAPAIGYIVYLLPVFRPRERVARRIDRDAPPKVWHREYLNFGRRVWLGSVAGILLSRFDQFMMSFLSSQHNLGIYAVAVNVGEIPLYLTAAIGAVLLTRDALNPDDQTVLRISKRLFPLIFVLASLISLVAIKGIPLVFGNQYSGSVIPCAILVFAAAVSAPATVCGTVLTARGHPELRSRSLALGFLVNAAAVFALVPPFGATGAAIATLLSISFVSTLNLRSLYRLGGPSISSMLLPWATGGSSGRHRYTPGRTSPWTGD